MRRRVTGILLLLFQVLFLNVVVPGHTRGMITLDGKASVRGLSDLDGGAGALRGCCAMEHRKGKEAPTSQDRADCAICHLAVRLTTPPPVDFHLAQLTLLQRAKPLPAPTIPSMDVSRPYWGRAPPPFMA